MLSWHLALAAASHNDSLPVVRRASSTQRGWWGSNQDARSFCHASLPNQQDPLDLGDLHAASGPRATPQTRPANLHADSSHALHGDPRHASRAAGVQAPRPDFSGMPSNAWHQNPWTGMASHTTTDAGPVAGNSGPAWHSWPSPTQDSRGLSMSASPLKQQPVMQQSLQRISPAGGLPDQQLRSNSESQPGPEFPRRPDQPVCDFYGRTGHCKFGAGCRFDHPPELAVSLNALGFPLRSGQPTCGFYARTGSCKFGPSCKFDHPR